ncbi:MAG: XamI family restriction endonuclease [Nitrospiraceae bacterium]|jgi:hypothetical protein|nr:XamI family restriction endonuclease [Nitrospiraceae bacterium]
MVIPPQWSEKQLKAEADRARALFRQERLQEPLKKWTKTFDIYEQQFQQLFGEYGLANPDALNTDHLVDILKHHLDDALRYLTGPPISADDLAVLADTSLSPSVLLKDREAAERVLATLRQAIDPRRFPWLVEGRLPSREEKSAAIIASATLVTAQRVSTDRRNEGKRTQEEAVMTFLKRIGFKEVRSRSITTLPDAPEPGEFCRESLVGSRKADIPVRLYDGRLMSIECKVSNSATNSVKRLNNDAAAKAQKWIEEFGTQQIVPVAVLSGVFKVKNLVQAQNSDLTLFWAHKLPAMRNFIMRTRSSQLRSSRIRRK